MNKTAQSNKHKILSVINTTEDLITLQNNIQELLKDLYHKNESDLSSLIDKLIPYQEAEIIKQDLVELKIDMQDKESARSYFEKLLEELETAEKFSLNIAYEPSAASVKLFTEYAKDKFGPDTVIELSINPDLIAGAIITYKGKYLDYSLGKKVSDLIDNKRDEIIGKFKV